MTRTENLRNTMSPGSAIFKHRVQDSKQFMHTCSNSHLFSFPSRTETLVEASDNWIIPCSYQCRHIKSSSYRFPSSPGSTFAPQSAAISVERCYTYQSSYLLTVQCAQLGQF